MRGRTTYCERMESSGEQETGNTSIAWVRTNGVIKRTRNKNTHVRKNFPRTERPLNAFLGDFQRTKRLLNVFERFLKRV